MPIEESELFDLGERLRDANRQLRKLHIERSALLRRVSEATVTLLSADATLRALMPRDVRGTQSIMRYVVREIRLKDVRVMQ